LGLAEHKSIHSITLVPLQLQTTYTDDVQTVFAVPVRDSNWLPTSEHYQIQGPLCIDKISDRLQGYFRLILSVFSVQTTRQCECSTEMRIKCL